MRIPVYLLPVRLLPVLIHGDETRPYQPRANEQIKRDLPWRMRGWDGEGTARPKRNH